MYNETTKHQTSNIKQSMAGDTCSFTVEINVNITSDDLLNNLVKLQLDSKLITVEKGKLKWMKSFESLKQFVATSLSLKGQWSSPSGHLKLFKDTSGSVTIRYYTNANSFNHNLRR